MPVRGGTELRAGDELLILADPDTHEEVAAPEWETIVGSYTEIAAPPDMAAPT